MNRYQHVVYLDLIPMVYREADYALLEVRQTKEGIFVRHCQNPDSFDYLTEVIFYPWRVVKQIDYGRTNK